MNLDDRESGSSVFLEAVENVLPVLVPRTEPIEDATEGSRTIWVGWRPKP